MSTVSWVVDWVFSGLDRRSTPGGTGPLKYCAATGGLVKLPTGKTAGLTGWL
jgi:hypothetical protein